METLFEHACTGKYDLFMKDFKVLSEVDKKTIIGSGFDGVHGKLESPLEPSRSTASDQVPLLEQFCWQQPSVDP